jgi:hypothetical protein
MREQERGIPGLAAAEGNVPGTGRSEGSLPHRSYPCASNCVAYALSADRYVLVIKHRTPAGVRTVTLHREDHAGPFTEADLNIALTGISAHAVMLPGQRNISRRAVTKFGTLWTHVMLGPPTWWLPRLRREQDGTVMAGWLRAAAAVRIERVGRIGEVKRRDDA